MTTTINADTVSGGAIITGDASGILGLQAGGNTGLTLNSSRAVGVGATPSFGTAGQVLVSGGSSAAPAWGSGGPIGTDLSYVDYSLTTSSAINVSVSASIYMQSISLDGTSELMIIYSTGSAHAVVWNSSTNTFGTPILVRTANLGYAQYSVALAKISSTAVLVCSLNTAALETVVLTVSGSTITVGTALATTLAASSFLIAPNTRLVTVGSSYVLNYYTTADSLPKFRAITVSGTTPSIGAELAYAGGTLETMHHSYAHSASILLHFSMTSATTVFVLPISVSGTTLSSGTAATVSTTSATNIVTGALSNSRYALAYLNTTIRGAVVSVAGSVASISTAATTMALVSSFNPMMQVFGNQAIILGGTTSENINVITDTAGVASLGTDLTTSINAMVGYLSTSKVFLASNTAGTSNYYQYGISSGSAVLEKTFQTVTDATAVNARVVGLAPYVRPLSGPPQSGSGNATMLRTSAGKIATGTSASLPFVASIDGTYPAKLQQSANPFVTVNTYNDAISDAVVWGFPTAQAASTTTVQLRKVTLA